MGVVAGEEQADRVGAGVVEDEGSGIAAVGEGAVSANNGDLIFEIRGLPVDVDVAVEADVDNRSEGETGSAAVFGDGLIEECRYGGG